ncbi:AAA family ATPase [Pseudofrankia sp. BMG5.37]|uniref:ExeA family protein n=1 Tax=Pseudofrankia sp. BMG5.37 TaxID=3050035 RepID=UPI002894E10C|nr:AAA family ATPase [Pseudofrankia sp. BMG5.37]MDT3446943.1 AAA family ATPase [Pseudofrankia sp. BMG5.37]
MSIDRMQAHYGFTKMPFGRDLPVSDLHRHRAHNEAVARIGGLIHTRGLGVLTGEVGAGKTAATRAATTTLDPSRHSVIYLPNPAVGVRGIHNAIATALGVTPRFHHATLIPQTADALAAETHERGRQPILIIDEAHLLDATQLEAVRMLTNTDMDSASPLTCLLIGQPTLRRRIKLGDMAALDQRYAMPAMDPDETRTYITHHARFAGRADTLFSDDAIQLIHTTARGLPRAVNNLAI